MTSYVMPTYRRLPVTMSYGRGVWLWDENGNRYLDCLAGVGVCGLGHSHPAVSRAICQQSESLLHTSNWYGISTQEQLADKLAAKSGMDNVFFANSGAEANEAALKIARLYGHSKGIKTPMILTADGSFHGRTLATISASGNDAIGQGFAPLLAGFSRVPFADPAAIATALQNNADIVAVFLEPVQGEGGINIPPSDYLSQVRKLCTDHKVLMMLDEVQTGMGRTGKMFAYQHAQITPDVCTLAKALGNGVPIGACLAKGSAAGLLGFGKHGSTFGGNPLACSAALAVLETLDNGDIIHKVPAKGARIYRQLTTALNGNALVSEIRHLGLMVAIDLTVPCAELTAEALAAGLLINVCGKGNTIRLLPPLIISDDEIDYLIQRLAPLIQNFCQNAN